MVNSELDQYIIDGIDLESDWKILKLKLVSRGDNQEEVPLIK